MEFTKQLQLWASGDASQGRIMVVVGVLLGISAFLIFRSDNQMLKGMLIPIGLLIVITLGYGSFLSMTRHQHAIMAEQSFSTNRSELLEKELKKAEVDNRNYTFIKPVWAVIMIISVVLYFVASKDYFKGLSMGLMALSLGGFLVDTFLHDRLKPYLEVLRQLTD